jgi:bifunctional non-homologous end joining protein LigD
LKGSIEKVENGDLSAGSMSLTDYRKKRDFQKTPEPEGSTAPEGRAFVVHKHAATRLHYDLRLELDGVLKSWAVPRGPSLNPTDKRLAVQVEDHPVEYADFEGVIPRGEYGAGTVLVWDRGTWRPEDGDPARAIRKGHLNFQLSGNKLHGSWTLTRMHGGKNDTEEHNWLLIKKEDGQAQASGAEIIAALPDSAKTGRSLEQVAAQETDDEVLQHRAALRNHPLAPAVASGMVSSASAESAPPRIEPELPTRVESAPEGEGWIHEIKYDGYRILSILNKGRVVMLSRRGHDWTAYFPALAGALARLPVERALLDGEVVAQNPEGAIRFQTLQNSLHGGEKAGILYYLFDLLHLNGYSTRSLALAERKHLLETLLQSVRESEPLLRYSEGIPGNGPAVFRAACRVNLEGIVSKRADSPYVSGRTKDWLKSKCREEREFVVAGFTALKSSDHSIGALILGFYERGALVYCGRVGTGFTEEERSRLFEQLNESHMDLNPFAEFPREELTAGDMWTAPRLVVQVRFAEWTEDGRLREPVYEGLREDKPPEEVVRESAQPVERGDSQFVRILSGAKVHASSEDTAVYESVRITHASRVMFPGQGLTKRDLAEYYLKVADGLLPEIRRRPLAILRCPSGQEGECFFQKHADSSMPDFLPRAALPVPGETKPYLMAEGIRDVLGLVQAGALEIHAWGCRVEDPLRPDRITFDLDPDPALDPSVTIAVALDLKKILESMELVSFVRVTGGKGLHIVVPVEPEHDWEEGKQFARKVALRVVRVDPERRTVAMAKDQRHGKVFIDYFRNARGASAIASYSTRAREGAPVAAPLEWGEVRPGLSFQSFSMTEVVARLERAGDPWRSLGETHQRLTAGRTRADES